MAKVWILCRDNGCEGLAEPFIGFESEAEADTFKERFEALSYGPMLRKVEAAFQPPAIVHSYDETRFEEDLARRVDEAIAMPEET